MLEEKRARLEIKKEGIKRERERERERNWKRVLETNSRAVSFISVKVHFSVKTTCNVGTRAANRKAFHPLTRNPRTTPRLHPSASSSAASSFSSGRERERERESQRPRRSKPSPFSLLFLFFPILTGALQRARTALCPRWRELFHGPCLESPKGRTTWNWNYKIGRGSIISKNWKSKFTIESNANSPRFLNLKSFQDFSKFLNLLYWATI